MARRDVSPRVKCGHGTCRSQVRAVRRQDHPRAPLSPRPVEAVPKAGRQVTTMREKEINETRRLLHLWGIGQVHSEKIVKRVAWHLDDADALESQLSEARAEVERLRAALEPYPMQHGPYIPTSIAKLVYRCYAAQYPGQSFDRIAERGGFGWEEVTILFRDLSRKQPALYKRSCPKPAPPSPTTLDK